MEPLPDRVPEKALLSLTYLGPVAYYSKYFLHQEILIECFDHYQKQTYRNRCCIYSANGPLSLTIPVLTGVAHKILVKDIRIDNDRSWKRLHLKGIEAAYRSAPFYEYYIDSLLPLYHREFNFLLDLNLGFHEVMLAQLNIPSRIALTEKYLHTTDETVADLREKIHPKKSQATDPYFIPAPYRQVFMERFGFRPNLSVIDLLFNMGPEAEEILKKSISLKA
jgi:hypothetical protein